MGLLAERLPAAEALAAGPSDALGATKAAINDATLTELDAAFARERTGQLGLLASPDFAECVDAFLGKRPARFGPRA